VRGDDSADAHVGGAMVATFLQQFDALIKSLGKK
jgi:hypothetical protein